MKLRCVILSSYLNLSHFVDDRVGLDVRHFTNFTSRQLEKKSLNLFGEMLHSPTVSQICCFILDF